MPDMLPQVASWAESLTIRIVLVIIIIAGYKRVWVWGWQYDAVVKERDFLRETTAKGVHQTERTVQIAETVVDKAVK